MVCLADELMSANFSVVSYLYRLYFEQTFPLFFYVRRIIIEHIWLFNALINVNPY